jgi:hypothetical protein
MGEPTCILNYQKTLEWTVPFLWNNSSATSFSPKTYTTYVIQAGDTLSKVAHLLYTQYLLTDSNRFFGEQEVLSILQKLNPEKTLQPGMVVKTPDYILQKTPTTNVPLTPFNPSFKERSRQISIGSTQSSELLLPLIAAAVAHGFNTFIIDLKDETGTVNPYNLPKIYNALKKAFPGIMIHYRIVCERVGRDILTPGSDRDQANQKIIGDLLQKYKDCTDGFVFDYIRFSEKSGGVGPGDSSRILAVNRLVQSYFDSLKGFAGQVRFCLFGATACLSDKPTVEKLGQDPLSFIRLGQASGLSYGFMVMSYASHYGQAYTFPAENLEYARRYLKDYPLKSIYAFTPQNPPVDNPVEVNALTIAPLRKYLNDRLLYNVGLYSCILGNSYGLSEGLTTDYLAGQYAAAEELCNGYYLFNVKDTELVNRACLDTANKARQRQAEKVAAYYRNATLLN